MTYPYDGIRSMIEYDNAQIEYLENKIKKLKEIKIIYEEFIAELIKDDEEKRKAFDKIKKIG